MWWGAEDVWYELPMIFLSDTFTNWDILFCSVRDARFFIVWLFGRDCLTPVERCWRCSSTMQCAATGWSLGGESSTATTPFGHSRRAKVRQHHTAVHCFKWGVCRLTLCNSVTSCLRHRQSIHRGTLHKSRASHSDSQGSKPAREI